MISVFRRAVLFRDPSAEAAAEIQLKLKAAGIPYGMKSVGNGSVNPAVRVPRTGRTGNMTSGSAYMGGGVPHSWTEGQSNAAYYEIYVAKKDLKKAKEVCDLAGD